MKKFLSHLSKEWLFYLSLFLFFLTSLFFSRFPKITTDEWKVVFTLAVFLVIIKGLERSGILKFFACKFERGSCVPLKLIFFTFFLSMFVTNDVALLVVVPLTVAMEIRDKAKVVILEALAANGGSALTPFGNPQNLFIYYHYSPSPFQFVSVILPLSAVTFLLLLFLSPGADAEVPKDKCTPFRKSGYVYLAFFLLFILTVLRIFPEWLGTIPLFYVLFFERKALLIDYFLLLTFLCFFGFTDNLSHHFKFSLDSSLEVFLYSSIGSQVISNVPAALFFSEFTDNWKALLWGVSVGGFGSLVSSMANLIAYRLYTEKEADGRFLLRFHIYGYFFFFTGVFFYFLLFGLK